MHLTNYSVNKHSDSFDNDESVGKGSKRLVVIYNTTHTFIVLHGMTYGSLIPKQPGNETINVGTRLCLCLDLNGNVIYKQVLFM